MIRMKKTKIEKSKRYYTSIKILNLLIEIDKNEKKRYQIHIKKMHMCLVN